MHANNARLQSIVDLRARPDPGHTAHCAFGLGLAYARAGVGGQAQKEIDAALAEYRAMDMPYWFAQAEQAPRV